MLFMMKNYENIVPGLHQEGLEHTLQKGNSPDGIVAVFWTGVGIGRYSIFLLDGSWVKNKPIIGLAVCL